MTEQQNPTSIRRKAEALDRLENYLISTWGETLELVHWKSLKEIEMQPEVGVFDFGDGPRSLNASTLVDVIELLPNRKNRGTMRLTQETIRERAIRDLRQGLWPTDRQLEAVSDKQFDARAVFRALRAEMLVDLAAAIENHGKKVPL